MKFAGIIEPGVASGIVTYSKYIQGTYIVVSDYSERDKIPTGVLVEGTPVYISSLNKTQRCHINNKVIEWVDDNASELSVGYYFEDKFYSDAEHTDEIEALQDKLYVDLGKNDLYIYHGGYICLTEVKVDMTKYYTKDEADLKFVDESELDEKLGTITIINGGRANELFT